MSLPTMAVRRPVATTMACLAVVLLGLTSLGELSVDLLPDVATPRITLMTRAPAMAPPEVERLVTVPLERAVSTVPGVRRLASVSREELSVLTLEFPWGIDVDLAALHVREALDKDLERLPREVERPAVLRWDPGSEPVMGLAVAGDTDLVALRELAASVIGPRLEQVAGIAGAQVTGGARREIHVQLAPDRLALHGLTVADVDRALRAANSSLQGGTVLKGSYRYHVRALGEFQSPEEIAEVYLGNDAGGGRIRVSDLGRVATGSRPRRAGALLDGQPAVGILLFREADSNSVAAVEAAVPVVEDLRTQYPELTLAVAFENASFIREAIAGVLQNVALGAFLAFAVLFLFMKDPRNPLLLGLSIPLSLVATLLLCYLAGIDLNLMTLGGLALGVGMLVDNSIVVLENVFRFREEGTDAETAARRGAEEVALAVTAATLTTVAVFLPVAYVHGVAGQLFAPQAWTVTFALLASLVVSLSVLPMLAARFLRLGDLGQRDDRTDRAGSGEPGNSFLDLAIAVPLFWIRTTGHLLHRSTAPVFDGFGRAYDAFAHTYHRTLTWCLDRKALTMLTAVFLMALGTGLAWRLPWELMPRVESSRFELLLEAPAGTPFERLEARVRRLEEAVRRAPGVASTFATVGVESATAPGAAAGAAELGPNRARLTVLLSDEKEGTTGEGTKGGTEFAIAAARAAVADLEEIRVTVDPRTSPLQRMLGLETSGLGVAIRGEDLEILERIAAETASTLRSIPGLADVKAHTARGNPEIHLRVRRAAASRYGASVEEVTESLLGALQGTLSTQYVEFDRRIDIRISARGNPGDLEEVFDRPFPADSGPVPLRELVERERATGPTEIFRVDRIREIPVTASLEGIPLSEAVARTEASLADLQLPRGTTVEIAGERQEVRRSFRSLVQALILASLLVYMVMAAQFESLLHPVVILCTLPLGWVGVVLGLTVTGLSINVTALIGAVVLTGIVVNDAIVKVDTINRLRRGGMERRQAVLRGSKLRLRPIVMTTVTTVFGLAPLALGLGAGAELQQPLAVAVIGGEATGTLLTLLVIPVAYELLDQNGSTSR